jgi:hypothetical protein
MNKFNAASTNLITAIRLYFEGNYVSCVTLAGSSRDVFDALFEKQKKGSSAKEFLAKHINKPTGHVVNILHQAYNWIKHADRDSDTELEIGKEDCEILLMIAIPAYLHLGGDRVFEVEKFSKLIPYFETLFAKRSTLLS